MNIKYVTITLMISLLILTVAGCTEKNQDDEWKASTNNSLHTIITPVFDKWPNEENIVALSIWGEELYTNTSVAINESRKYTVSSESLLMKTEYEAALKDMRNASIEIMKAKDTDIFDAGYKLDNAMQYINSSTDHMEKFIEYGGQF